MSHFLDSVTWGTNPDSPTYPIAGYASGYKIARGEATLTANATVATGLSTVVDFVAVPYADTATKANTSPVVTIADSATAGSILIYRWKHTGASTPTLVASTTAGTVNWVAVGT